MFYPYPGTQLFRECRDKGYLPDNYAGMPANHSQSVLKLPHLSQAEITEYYDKFTALRVRDSVNRMPRPADGDKHDIRRLVETTAAAG